MSYGTVQAEKMTTESGYSLGAGNASSFKNRLINGAMQFDQRNAGASYSPANSSVVYGADRWITFSAGAGITAQRISNSGITGFPFAFRQTGASGNTYASFVQRIESANCLDLVGQQVTVSLFVATSNSSNVRIGIEYAGSTDNFNTPTVVQQQTIATTSTLTRYSVTFNALPSQVANGIQLDIEATSGIGVGVTFTITGVQLEVGTVATSFDFRSIGTELSLCQRYYEKSYEITTVPGTAIGNNGAGSVALYNATGGAGPMGISHYMKVSKRTTPTVTVYSSSSGASGFWDSAGTPNAVTISTVGSNQFFVYGNGNNNYMAWTASSEL